MIRREEPTSYQCYCENQVSGPQEACNIITLEQLTKIGMPSEVTLKLASSCGLAETTGIENALYKP